MAFVLALTGPIAAGKNAAQKILEKRGFACIDADAVVHQVIPRKQGEILAAFSPLAVQQRLTLLDSAGNIDRRALGQILFAHPEAVRRQEEIVYPEVCRLLEQFINEHTGKPVALNAALLYKVPIMARCNAVLYVDAPKILRVYRIKRRNRLKFTDIFARIRSQSQIFTHYRRLSADIYRVWNIGSLAGLEKKIDRFLADCEKKGYGIWNKNKPCG